MPCLNCTANMCLPYNTLLLGWSENRGSGKGRLRVLSLSRKTLYSKDKYRRYRTWLTFSSRNRHAESRHTVVNFRQPIDFNPKNFIRSIGFDIIHCVCVCVYLANNLTIRQKNSSVSHGVDSWLRIPDPGGSIRVFRLPKKSL